MRTTKVQDANSSEIAVELVSTNFFTRWPCTVCGGHTEKVGVLAEATIRCEGDETATIRVCERCLEAGDIDARLERNAADLELAAAARRGLIGRLKVPTYAEWEAREEREDVAHFAAHESEGAEEYNAVLNDDAVFEKWRRRREDWRALSASPHVTTGDELFA
jgi:hypothetical protein